MSERSMTSIRIDVLYALRQLKEHRCIDRAVDALERIGEATEAWALPAELFDAVWDVMVESGLCDDKGSGEYQRVLADWLASPLSRVMYEFIRAHANATPSSRPDLFHESVEDVCDLSNWKEAGAINPGGPAWEVDPALTTAERLVVHDVGPWNQRMTVTNGIEAVLQYLLQCGELRGGRRFLYFDSDGQLTEALYEGPKFLGYRAGVI